VIDTCHMCHVAVRSTPVGPSPGVVGTHAPTTHHLPGCFWEVPRVFGSSTGVLGSSRDVRGRSGCFWEVPRVFLEVPGVFGKFPGRLGIPRAGTVFCFAKSKIDTWMSSINDIVGG
jgi:hypothetical protein